MPCAHPANSGAAGGHNTCHCHGQCRFKACHGLSAEGAAGPLELPARPFACAPKSPFHQLPKNRWAPNAAKGTASAGLLGACLMHIHSATDCMTLRGIHLGVERGGGAAPRTTAGQMCWAGTRPKHTMNHGKKLPARGRQLVRASLQLGRHCRTPSPSSAPHRGSAGLSSGKS